MESNQREQGTRLVEWLARYAVEMLQDEVAPFPDPHGLLSVVNDWVAIAFEARLAHTPEKADLCSVMQASIIAAHTHLTRQTNRGGLLYTFGYAMPCADAVIEQLVALDVVIVDIRYSPNSRVAKWRQAQLQERLGEHYLHVQALGNVNYNRPGAPLHLFHSEHGVNLVSERLQRGQHLALMCMCREVEECHRLEAARKVQEQFPGVILIHL